MAANLIQLNHQTTTGFYKAPVCKGVIFSSFLTCTAIHVPMIAHLRQYLACRIPHILYTQQIWRLLFNRLTFIHTKDVLCSALVIFYFRIFERRMGSKKFASHMIGSCILALIFEISTIILLNRFNIDYHNGGYLPPGLYGFIFPFYVNYFLDIPRVTVTHFLGVPVTGKTITYLLGLQIALTSPATIISALSGVLGGIVYRLNILKVQRWLRVPDGVSRVCDKVLGWALYSKEPKQNPMGATVELQRQEQADTWEQQYIYNRAQDFREVRQGQSYTERLVDDLPADDGGLVNYLFRNRGRSNRVEPSNENIQILSDMGFDRQEVIDALQQSRNDLQTATSILLRQ